MDYHQNRYSRRGQASVLGVVFILAITVIGISGVLLFGSAALETSQAQADIDAAEQAMTQLDSKLSLVGLGTSAYQKSTVPIRSGASLRVDEHRGWMNVSVINQTDGSVEVKVLNTTLGAVVYEHGETSVAYQGGGVWKRAGAGHSIMVSPPEVHYRTHSGTAPTLTLPLVVVRGTGSVSERVVAHSTGSTAKYPLQSSNRSNPLERGQVNITVQSEYYRAWGVFFEERTGGAVSYDHGAAQVTVSLRAQASAPAIDGGIVSGEDGATLTFEDQAETDSYNSSAGNYTATAAANTSILTAGSVELHNQATLFGDLVAGDSVTLQSKAEITGNVSYGDTLSNDGTIGGWTRNDADVPTLNAVGWLITEKRETFESSNDNAGAAAIDDSSDTLTGCSTTCTLTEGEYILQNVSLGNGEELVLDSSSGDVEVVVRDDVGLSSDGTIRVEGGGSARFYVDNDLLVGNDGNLTVPSHRSPGLWFYMRPGAEATFEDQSRFVGVIYGPGDGAQDGVDITMIEQATMYGGLVGSVYAIPNGIGVHFDEALTDEDPLSGVEADRPPVTYMHVTVHKVNVSSQ